MDLVIKCLGREIITNYKLPEFNKAVAVYKLPLVCKGPIAIIPRCILLTRSV